MRIRDRIVIFLIIAVMLVGSCYRLMIIENNFIYPVTVSYEQSHDAYLYFNVDYVETPDTETVIADIEELYNKELNYRFGTQNYCNIMTGRITLNPSTRYFPVTVAHETEHTNFVLREYMANYNAIIKLWESDVPYLKYNAGKFARSILSNGFHGNNYDCTNLLVEYKESIWS